MGDSLGLLSFVDQSSIKNITVSILENKTPSTQTFNAGTDFIAAFLFLVHPDSRFIIIPSVIPIVKNHVDTSISLTIDSVRNSGSDFNIVGNASFSDTAITLYMNDYYISTFLIMS